MTENMTLFYDALIYLGRDARLEAYQVSDLSSIRRMLDKYRIAKALVAAYAARDLDPAYGNDLVFAAAEQDTRLVPCPAVIPNSGLEVGNEAEYVAGLVRRGARCVSFYPQSFGTGLDRRVVGDLFAAIERHRLPMSLFETGAGGAASVAADYPGIAVIIHRPDSRNRTLLPMLRAASNLFVSLMPNFCPYRGLEVLVNEFGAERFVFASGYPEAEPGAPVSQLLYSELSDTDRDKIAWGNLAALIGGVRVDPDAPPQQAETEPPEPERLPALPTDTLRERAWRRERLPWEGVTDMHAHYGKWARFPIWEADADDLVAEMDRLGVDRIILSPEAVMSTETAHGNKLVLEAMGRHPGRILGWATCYPATEAMGIGEIRRCIEAGMIGIKMHSGAGIPYTSENYQAVWEFADERRLPVQLHTWGDINQFDPIFERYRNAPILLAHAGAANQQMYVEYARRFPNIYLDLCYSMAPYGLVEYFVRELGPERIDWGSDAPWMSMQQQLGRVIFADITEADKKCILVENPKRILEAAARN